jgi:hypothetical protein
VTADNAASVKFTCPVCGMTSYHPIDVAEGYCGDCHDWTSDLPLWLIEEKRAERR